jgi:hypothetical protein
MGNSGKRWESIIAKTLMEHGLPNHGNGVVAPETNDEYIFRDLSEICYYTQPIGMSFDFLLVGLSDDDENLKHYIENGLADSKGNVDFVIALEKWSKKLHSYFPNSLQNGINRIRIEGKFQQENGSVKDKIERSLEVLRTCPEGNALLVVGGDIYDNPEYLRRYKNRVDSRLFNSCSIMYRKVLIEKGLLPASSPLRSTVRIMNLVQFNEFLSDVTPVKSDVMSDILEIAH